MLAFVASLTGRRSGTMGIMLLSEVALLAPSLVHTPSLLLHLQASLPLKTSTPASSHCYHFSLLLSHPTLMRWTAIRTLSNSYMKQANRTGPQPEYDRWTSAHSNPCRANRAVSVPSPERLPRAHDLVLPSAP
jgi:hypothetical protein